MKEIGFNFKFVQNKYHWNAHSELKCNSTMQQDSFWWKFSFDKIDLVCKAEFWNVWEFQMKKMQAQSSAIDFGTHQI